MELAEIQTYFEANKDKPEVQKFVNGFVTSDRVNAFLGTDEGAKIIQPIKDQHFSKSLESWKSKNLQTIIDEEVGKRSPKETEDQKRLRKLEEENLAIRKQNKISEFKNKASKFASEKNIPVALLDHLNYPETDEELNGRLGAIAEIFKDLTFKQNGRQRPASHGNSDPRATMNDIIRQAAGHR